MCSNYSECRLAHRCRIDGVWWVNASGWIRECCTRIRTVEFPFKLEWIELARPTCAASVCIRHRPQTCDLFVLRRCGVEAFRYWCLMHSACSYTRTSRLRSAAAELVAVHRGTTRMQKLWRYFLFPREIRHRPVWSSIWAVFEPPTRGWMWLRPACVCRFAQFVSASHQTRNRKRMLRWIRFASARGCWMYTVEEANVCHAWIHWNAIVVGAEPSCRCRRRTTCAVWWTFAFWWHVVCIAIFGGGVSCERVSQIPMMDERVNWKCKTGVISVCSQDLSPDVSSTSKPTF